MNDNLKFESKSAIKNEKIRLAKVVIYIGLDGEECNTKCCHARRFGK